MALNEKGPVQLSIEQKVRMGRQGWCELGSMDWPFFHFDVVWQVTEALEPSFVEASNESHLHAHHAAMKGVTNKETHFKYVRKAKHSVLWILTFELLWFVSFALQQTDCGIRKVPGKGKSDGGMHTRGGLTWWCWFCLDAYATPPNDLWLARWWIAARVACSDVENKDAEWTG